MSSTYAETGRASQKQRTRQALVAAARELVTSGADPTIEEAAKRASISRATAYRYFTTKRELLVAAHPEIAVSSMLPQGAPSDVSTRLDMVITAFTDLIANTERQQRTMLRMSLEPATDSAAPLPLRQGRAISWIAEALEPLRDQLTNGELGRLVYAIRAATGIEARVWLADIAGLEPAEASELMRWSAQALLRHALTDPPPTAAEPPPTHRSAGS